jgi:glucuronate isomerase
MSRELPITDYASPPHPSSLGDIAMSDQLTLQLPEDRFFDPNPAQKEVALHLYRKIRDLPLICPHGHVDPKVFADPDYSFGTPADLLIIPDHYVFRMLYSQGVALESLGIMPRNGISNGGPGEKDEDSTSRVPAERLGLPIETDHRRIWQTFAEHYYLFRGTPTGMWLNHELYDLFEVREPLNGQSAQAIYDQIEEKLAQPEFRPRRLYERFQIETLCTTDPATSTLSDHQAIRDSGWEGQILPTFRPDALFSVDHPTWP